jgi:hypothetical protein
MSKKSRFVLVMLVLIAAGGLAITRCGRSPGAPTGESAAGRAFGAQATPDAAKSEDRLPSKKRTGEEVALAKIKFKLDEIRADGLRGPADGLVSVSYEFCVPKDEQTFAELRKIAPGVAIHAGSKGRIGCSDDQALCIGSTSGEGWREVLLAIAELGYVAEIRECHFE